MRSKYTPGPWIVDGNGFQPASWNVSGHETVCDVTNEANAYLIAAAPELLDALRTLLAAHPLTPGHSPYSDDEAVEAALAAIAKAEGELK